MSRKTKCQLIDETIAEAKKLSEDCQKRREAKRLEAAERKRSAYNAVARQKTKERTSTAARKRLEAYPPILLANLLKEARKQLEVSRVEKARYTEQLNSQGYTSGAYQHAGEYLGRAAKRFALYVSKIRLLQEVIMAKRERSE